ncbi:Ribonuclease III [Hyphodiscus hymeniophilus]|uniref:Ribonuclease III n=1 Tax=Hyphodiscus hymeniophilus TaxID=353542 RepID=A0A9P7AYY5_9HELO|nr:Ribonuclease III [Hyphodiscus hymeniophilus]
MVALQAAGSGIGGPDGNKMLAMIGDTVMKLVLLVDMMATKASRGTIDSTISSIVSNNNLAAKYSDAGIPRWINGNPSQQGMKPPKTRADTIEAILGAVYLDSDKDLDAVRRVMGRLGLAAPNYAG